MKRQIVMVASVLFAVAASAAVTTNAVPAKKAAPKLTNQATIYAKTGGWYVVPGSQKGLALVVNLQDEVAATNISSITRSLAIISLINFRYVKEDLKTLGNGDWQGYLESKGAKAGVFVIADDKSAPLLVSPDEHWAVVNVRKLAVNLNDAGRARFLGPRTQKQILRAFAAMSGSVSRAKGSPASALDIRDLDWRLDMMPMDQIQQLSDYLGRMGLTHLKKAPYIVACRQGWAPAPTNEYQKAIWDKVHQMPSEPLKIKPETKKVAD